MLFESGPGIGPSLRDLPRHLNLVTISHGFVGWVFSITGPMLILLSVAEQGNLPEPVTVSWIFTGLMVGGITSWILSLYYRQPLTVAITIPGMVLVGTALSHITFAEAVGAYWVTGILLIFIGLSGRIRSVMDWFPHPIVMAMVAGVFLPFGLNIIGAWASAPWIAAPATVVFLVLSLWTKLARFLPPILGAILVAVFMAATTGRVHAEFLQIEFARLLWVRPVWSIPAIIELSIPLLLSVVAVHNAQGFMVLRMANYRPPLNAMTWACGLGTVANAAFGSAPACITGPVTAIISPPSAGPAEGRYAAGIVVGTLWLLAAVFAPVVVSGREVLPAVLINLLAGLALFSVLCNAFVAAFDGPFRFGALACFMLTISGVTIWNVGAPFWGMVAGLLVSAVLERGDFQGR